MHTVTPPCSSTEGCAEIVRNIQTRHMEELKYWDIGESFLIGGNGKVFEGAGWLRVGAHTYGYNRRSIGISLIGNFNINTPTQEALDAARNLIKCGVEKGHLSPQYHVVAHKQLIATESPGRKLYSEVRRWPDWLENADSIKNKQR
ncbi:Peptidoglycan recognition protein SA [Operophtera brumata]|uniref:Peptidoglycan recognition protein n=1 Tax=Operophtera brumata TaxID=104452 RepID=A0A0L7KJ86_OPEBR|nr:Peptidoglycan recognition protein SA [Operophtera brumata]